MYGIIFDVDGVIADTEAVNARATIKAFADLMHAEGIVRADFELGLGRGAQQYILAAARVHGLTLSDEQLAAMTEARERNILAMFRAEPLPAFPGILELIAAAQQESQWRLGIATSGSREISQAILQGAKVPYQQMAYTNGSEVTHKKPHPELFLRAIDKLQVPAERCVVIEDAPDGVAAAQAAGAKCVAITNSVSAEKLAAAQAVVNSATQLNLARLQGVIEGKKFL